MPKDRFREKTTRERLRLNGAEPIVNDRKSRLERLTDEFLGDAFVLGKKKKARR